MNKVIMTGYVLTEVESTTTHCNFLIKTKNAQDGDVHRIVAFDRLKELCTTYLRPGKNISVSGRLTYKKSSGKATIVIDEVEFL